MSPSPKLDAATTPLLRGVLDNIVAFAGTLTPDGHLTEANEPALRAAGLDRKDVIGRPFWDCYWWNFDTDTQNRLRAAVADARRGESVRYDVEVRVAGDQRIYIDFQLAPHRDASGRVDYLVASGVDISARKLGEDSLRAAHDSFRHLVTNAPFGIFAVDSDFRLAMLSAGAEKVFGTVTPLVGRDFAEVMRRLWPEPFASVAITHFRRTLDTGIPYHAPSTVERRQDTDLIESYDWKMERVTLPDRRPGVVCYFYDLSERESHAADLRESEARFRATFENAAVGIAHVAPDGSWLRVNTKLCHIVGYTPDELVQLSFQDITHPEDLDKDLSLLTEVLSGARDEYEMEKRYRRKDGSLVWVNLTVGCVRNRTGSVAYLISAVEDISDKKEAEARQRLLVGELNHRVKNILATIQAMASHTMRNTGDFDTFRETFSGRLRAIAAAHDSIFSEGGGEPLLADLIRRQLAPYAAEGRDRLLLSGPPVVLGTTTAHALGLILHELATNATKYGALSTEGGSIRISWSPVGADRRVRLDWTESGGPEVNPPDRTGFGTRLIESTLQHSLQGSAQIDYAPSGLAAEFVFVGDEERDGR